MRDAHLLGLSNDLLLTIVERLVCDIGMAGLAGCCSTLRTLLPAAVIEKRIAALVDQRGWRVSNLRIAAGNVGNVVRVPQWAPSMRFGLRRRYASRVRSLPLPHQAWEIGDGHCLRVGSGHGVRADFRSLRAALQVASDGDTILLDSGEFDEGSRPLTIDKSIRIVGAADTTCNADATCNVGTGYVRPSASSLTALLVATSGRGAICGVTLRPPPVPRASNAPPPNPFGAAGADEWQAADADAPADETHERCFAVTNAATWALEDCFLHGGCRAGSSAELAIVGCVVAGDSTRPPSTGVIVQGTARVLVRASIVKQHLRSGVTVQHGGRLWLHHTYVGGNALAGVKLVSRAPCVLSCCSISHNAHMGVLLRNRAMCVMNNCEIASNGMGVACIQHTRLLLNATDIRGNGAYIFATPKPPVSSCLVQVMP